MWELLPVIGRVASWAGDVGLGVALALWTHGQAPEVRTPPAPPEIAAPRPPPAKPRPRPHAAKAPEGKRLVLDADGDNQCHVEASAKIRARESFPFSFLIDTGSWTIAFGPQHVRAMGLDPDALNYNRSIWTANGTGRAADIRLDELRIGDFVLRDVPAQVDQGGLDTPLLGASVLKLARLEFTRGQCVLTLPPGNGAVAMNEIAPAPSPLCTADGIKLMRILGGYSRCIRQCGAAACLSMREGRAK